MLITNAILSLLSFEDMSGYDIKKKIQETSYFPWSGNNNQVYKALSELQEKGFVISENIIQTNAPTKKVYSITKTGREQLKIYAKSEFATIQFNKTFLIRLLSASDLSKKEILEIINTYKNQLCVDISKLKVLGEAGDNAKDINNFILKWINYNEVKSIKSELAWLEELENDLNSVEFSTNNEENNVVDNTHKVLKYEVNEDLILYTAKFNDKDNIASAKYIKDITFDVIENNCTGFVLERVIFSKDSLTSDLLKLMDFEFKKYNINFKIV